ncbi:NAD(P)/FAD-dependent oxidoreductase [Puniceibacterium sp. IMCC21224]|uniref:NAD(P)/FAD-dependent oxidoreductase n=1 Tax=Puniceibacterium sp. IMCC21224 TaxID=1618204 RepID=UPI00064DCB9A|nr:FAD-dependent oxidoreductase [Puniceibacterium sp. IMCC21224]KMK69008.1 NAD(FAD)-dependent dehydrogenase [Puniceibacterium sp. IMCC21224]
MAGSVIIGAGECGVRAAFTLRELGYDGSVTLIGAEQALPYERPPLSKDLTGAAREIRAKEAYAAADIDLKLGAQVVGIDVEGKKVGFEDGTSLAYDRLLIATGARPRLFPGMEGCATLRTDSDARRILSQFTAGARIGIVGGGFIGLELAATARRAGAEVSVIEAAPRILGRAVPPEIAAVVHARHEREGVRIRTGTGVLRACAMTITLTDGTALAFDIVIAGVGAVPNVELAQAAGLHCDNGVVVDPAFRTSAPDIYAAGDCCNFDWRGNRVRLESWKAAQDQGAHAAAAMLGAGDDFAKAPWFWSDQFDLTLQVAGLFDLSAPIHRRDTSDDTHIVFQCDLSGGVSAAAGVGPGNAIAKDIKIFEKLIERATPVDPGSLADASTPLKRLLKA